MDDDLFLTAPWTLADFVGADGGQVLTGQHIAMQRLDVLLLGPSRPSTESAAAAI
jgi:hypothetical protein